MPSNGTVQETEWLSSPWWYIWDEENNQSQVIRHVEKNSNAIKMQKMAESLLDNRSRDMWAESRKIKGRNNTLPCWIDGGNVISVGCQMGIHFIDDLNQRASTLSGLKLLIYVCEKYADEYNIKFNVYWTIRFQLDKECMYY